MTRQMSERMQGQLGQYNFSLQARYGDPRVYAMQQEQMRRDQAAVEHSKAKDTSQLLQDAYKRQAERNRETHYKRINQSVRPSAPPESEPKKRGRPRKTPLPSAAAGPSD